jgi:hypothetical protein
MKWLCRPHKTLTNGGIHTLMSWNCCTSNVAPGDEYNKPKQKKKLERAKEMHNDCQT